MSNAAIPSYLEIIDFIAAGTTPQAVADYHPSTEAQQRVAELIAREKEGGLSPEEKAELDHFMDLEADKMILFVIGGPSRQPPLLYLFFLQLQRVGHWRANAPPAPLRIADGLTYICLSDVRICESRSSTRIRIRPGRTNSFNCADPRLRRRRDSGLLSPHNDENQKCGDDNRNGDMLATHSVRIIVLRVARSRLVLLAPDRDRLAARPVLLFGQCRRLRRWGVPGPVGAVLRQPFLDGAGQGVLPAERHERVTHPSGRTRCDPRSWIAQWYCRERPAATGCRRGGTVAKADEIEFLRCIRATTIAATANAATRRPRARTGPKTSASRGVKFCVGYQAGPLRTVGNGWQMPVSL